MVDPFAPVRFRVSMYPPPKDIETRVCSRLPDAFREPRELSEWEKFELSGLSTHSFLEGPSFDRDGRLYCVDIAGGRIFRVSQGGEWELFKRYDGEPTGLKIHADGRIFVADNKRGILEIDPISGTITPFIQRVNLEPLRGCNDLVFADNGDLYFTVPGQSSLTDPTGRVYRATPSGETSLLLGNVPYPNGLVLDAAQASLYIAAMYANQIWRVPLGGATSPAMGVGVFVQLSGGLGPDGLALDMDGNLVVAQARHGAVWVFSDLGEPLYRVRSCAGRSVTNLAFGGADNCTLFITEAATGSILCADMPIAGRPMFSHRAR